MMEKILLTQRVNREAAATPSTEAGTHGKASIPSAQAGRFDSNSTSIKAAVSPLLSFIIVILTLKTKTVCNSDTNKIKQNFQFFRDQRVVLRKKSCSSCRLDGPAKVGARRHCF